jgi:hypothetical protein
MNKKFVFESTGNREQDEAVAEHLQIREERLRRGECANGCGKMHGAGMPGSPTLMLECPKCGFVFCQ